VMLRGIVFVFLCALSFLPGVVRADAIQGRTVEEALGCEIVSTNPGPQEAGGWWTTVCRPQAISDVLISAPIPVPEGSAMQAYEVAFTERFGSNNGTLPGEFMAVVVKKGVFALDLRGDSTAEVLVTSPAGKMVTVLQPDTEAYPMEEGSGVTYSIPDNPVLLTCELGCKLDTAQPVLLEEGYTAILKQGTTCLICLLGELGESQQFEEGSGLLSVFVLLPDTNTDSFSWVINWDDVEPTVDLAPSETPTRFAWAFNPGNSRCGGG
ncbi:MAG: hypothetical protein KC442_23350, partial [Thermomicrobiales bacterium]|nr:hypothetical protein [Thermomicrobiales bacterium]